MDVKATGQLRPNYHLLTVLYAPPGTSGGNSSSMVQYTNGSTTGTTVSIDSSFQAGVDVTATVGDGLGSTEFSASQTTDNTSSVSVNDPAGLFAGHAHAGFPSNRGDFLIADSCNFAASSEYRTPVHFVS